MALMAIVVGSATAITGCAGERPILLDAAAVDAGVGTTVGTGTTTPAPFKVDGPVMAPGQAVAADDNPLAGFRAVDRSRSGMFPARGGVTAVVTPTGVVTPVVGETESGYVVESPCGIETEIAWGQPLESVEVVLDPGHGGSEQGAVAESGLTESELNLRVARRTALTLQDREISVALTRTADYRVPVLQRARLADALEADALVSIHHNTPKAAPSARPGTEVYVQGASDDSQRLGGVLYEEVTAALSRFDVDWVSRTDAGVLTVIDDNGADAFGLNRHPRTVTALVELGYLANPAEVALFETEEYLEAAATALADGIERYLTSADAGTGYVQTPRIFNPSDETGGVEGCVGPALE